MASPLRAPGSRRLASLLLAVVAITAMSAPAGVTASTAVSEATLAAQESAMLGLLNADRTALGLVPLRADPRLMAIARARSNDMVAKGYFSHTQPDGRNVFDILTAQHITWYGGGEIIAWNNYPMDSMASAANRQWMNSPGHRAIIVSTGFNYFGVGLAVDPATGKKVWTGVFLKGPDRTGARATMGGPVWGTWATSTTRNLTLTWSGYDVRLQVLTSGLRSFVLQRRVDGGSWSTIVSSTTARKLAVRVSKGHRYEFRVAARDNALNPSSWSTQVVDLR